MQKMEQSQKEKIAVLKKEYLANPTGFTEKVASEPYPDDFEIKAIKRAFISFMACIEDGDKIDVYDIARQLTDIWNADLIKWLGFPNSAGFVDTVLKDEPAKKSIFEILQAGQFLEYRELLQGLYNLLEN